MMNFTYKILSYRIIDGDTIEADIDLGFSITFKSKFRMLWYAPEIDSNDLGIREKAIEITNYFKSILEKATANAPIYIQTNKDKKEKYGRYLADIVFSSGFNMSELIKKEFPDWIK